MRGKLKALERALGDGPSAPVVGPSMWAEGGELRMRGWVVMRLPEGYRGELRVGRFIPGRNIPAGCVVDTRVEGYAQGVIHTTDDNLAAVLDVLHKLLAAHDTGG